MFRAKTLQDTQVVAHEQPHRLQVQALLQTLLPTQQKNPFDPPRTVFLTPEINKFSSSKLLAFHHGLNQSQPPPAPQETPIRSPVLQDPPRQGLGQGYPITANSVIQHLTNYTPDIT